MIGFGKKNKTINVLFIENGTSEPFAVSDVPVEQLPDTFEIDTIMHLDEDDWQVVGAEPLQKSEFCKTGSLKLFLKKNEVLSIDPKEILYSLSTISNDIAGVRHSDSLENIAVFEEDDWRQIEFISTKFENEINEEFFEITNIYKNHKEGIGFNKIHLRQKVSEPLEIKNLYLNKLEEQFDMEMKYAGVAFNNVAAVIVNGFAFYTKTGWIFWGQINESGKIIFLNLSRTKNSELSSSFADTVDLFLTKEKLYLVDWPALFWAGYKKGSFNKYIE